MSSAQFCIVIEGINPEPWMAPDLTTLRRGGRTIPAATKKEALRSYQMAVKESVEAAYDDGPITAGTNIWLRFYFWRQLELEPVGDQGRMRRRRRVDATNLQKSLEDALQGVLYENDRDVVWPMSFIIAQDHDVTPRIVIAGGHLTMEMCTRELSVARSLKEDAIRYGQRPTPPGNVTVWLQGVER